MDSSLREKVRSRVRQIPKKWEVGRWGEENTEGRHGFVVQESTWVS